MNNLLKNKSILLFGGGLIIIIALLTLLLTPQPKSDETGSKLPDAPQSTPQTQLPSSDRSLGSKKVSIPTSTPIISAALQQAIDEAKQSAREYDDAQANTLTRYFWIRKLPLASPKYYVYFDLEKEVFIGKLYPASGDNVEKMKTDIRNLLINIKRIPKETVEKTPFEWTVSPR